MHLKIGATAKADFPHDGIADKPQPGFDLPRRSNRKARIPDARNDENLAVAQTHLAFIRFHNRVVDKLAADGVPEPQRFAAARELVVKHYQWMVRTDYLPRIVKPQLVERVFTEGRKVFETSPVPGDSPTMPVEFSVAAFRLGHSMIRTAYNWNHVFDDGAGTLDFLFTFSGTSGDLGGFSAPAEQLDRRLPAPLRLHGGGPQRPAPDRGRPQQDELRARASTRCWPTRSPTCGPARSAAPSRSPRRRNLAFRNLTRARMLNLATGQQMLALMRSRGVTVTALTPAQDPRRPRRRHARHAQHRRSARRW